MILASNASSRDGRPRPASDAAIPSNEVYDSTDAANAQQYQLTSDPPSKAAGAIIDLLPRVEYEHLPADEVLDRIVPDALVGQELIDLFASLEKYEKRWLRPLVDLRLRLIDEMEKLIKHGLAPFGFDETNDLQYPNPAGIDRFFTFRDMVEEMAGSYEKLLKLRVILGKCWLKFSRKEHYDHLDGKQLLLLPDLKEKARVLDVAVCRLLHWANPLDPSQPNRSIQIYNGRRSSVEILEELREEARRTFESLA